MTEPFDFERAQRKNFLQGFIISNLPPWAEAPFNEAKQHGARINTKSKRIKINNETYDLVGKEIRMGGKPVAFIGFTGGYNDPKWYSQLINDKTGKLNPPQPIELTDLKQFPDQIRPTLQKALQIYKVIKENTRVTFSVDLGIIRLDFLKRKNKQIAAL